MRRIEIDKLERAGFLSGSYRRYRTIVAQYKKELRKGKTKLQAIHDAGAKKGACERTVYDAIRAIKNLQ